jgi:hypothetical protein
MDVYGFVHIQKHNLVYTRIHTHTQGTLPDPRLLEAASSRLSHVTRHLFQVQLCIFVAGIKEWKRQVVHA